MKRLKLLQLDGNFEYLSRNLRWLSWNAVPLTSIPTDLYQENLVYIELENTNVNAVWRENQVLILIQFFALHELFQCEVYQVFSL